MNTEAWGQAFCNQADEISGNEAFEELLEEERHHEFKSMTIHHIYGSFKCAKCKK